MTFLLLVVDVRVEDDSLSASQREPMTEQLSSSCFVCYKTLTWRMKLLSRLRQLRPRLYLFPISDDLVDGGCGQVRVGRIGR
jgi:hypothetical protein